MSRGERRTMKAGSAEDILRQPEIPTKEELMDKKKKVMIKKYGKPLRKPLDKKEIIRRFGHADT